MNLLEPSASLAPTAVANKQDEKRLSPLVLIVEDDRTTSMTLQGILAGAGFRTLIAGDQLAAWAGIREQGPDLMLLDVNLPDGSGFDLCQKLQTDPVLMQMPVLFISANNDLGSKVRGFEVGGVDYISKPLAGAEVLARVSTHLRLKRAREQLVELQAENLERLAAAQKASMPLPKDLPEAKFMVALKQKLVAGGDFYDVIPSGEQSVDYLVADASGHDLGASYWTAALKVMVAEYANPLNTPSEVLRALNGALGRILPSGAFFTIIYARLNRRTRRLTLVNAGHPPAIITFADGREPQVVQQEGDVVGSFHDAVFGVAELTLRPGDRLFLYSDGLVETDGPASAGVKRLAEACKARSEMSLVDLVPCLLEAVTAGQPATDDMVLLGVDA
jgi:sigma-B regulation protein RsbU (phosphoserine phosphatase)